MPCATALTKGPCLSPTLSLIIPCKDGEPFLPTLFETLLRQDVPDLEIVFVNDGSSDRTGEVAEAYGEKFSRFTLLNNPQATGLANARNQGLDIVNGDLIGFLDGDDWLRPGHLHSLISAIEQLDVDFVRCDHIRVTGHRRSLVRAPMALRNTVLPPRTGILPVDDSTMVDYPYAWAGIFNRRVHDNGLLRFPADLMTAEDRSWIWRLHLECDSFAVVDAPGVCYRRGVSTSLTQIFDARRLDFLPAFEGVFDIVENDRDADLFWPKVARNWLAICAHHISSGASMTNDVRKQLKSGIRRVTRRIPPAVLAEVMRDFDARRLANVMPFISATTWRTYVEGVIR